MAKRSNYGVLTLQLKGEDSGLSSTMGKASKATKKYTGTIQGLAGTYTELSSKLGLAAAAMTMVMKTMTVAGKAYTTVASESGAYLDAVDSIQETLTTLPLGFGEAARASFEFGEMLGITSAKTRKMMRETKAYIIEVRDELKGLNKQAFAEGDALRLQAKRTALGWSDQDIARVKKQEDLMTLARDRYVSGKQDSTASGRARIRIVEERDKIQKRLMKGGQSWSESFAEAEKLVDQVRDSFYDLEQDKVDLARAQLARQKKNTDTATKAAYEGNMQQIFRDRLQFRLETRLGKDAAVGLGAMDASKEDMRKVVRTSYKAAVRLAQNERAKVDIAKRLGVGVGDLGELGADKLKKMVMREGKVAMADLDQRAKTEVGRMLIAAEHMAKVEGDRIAQERESEKLAKTKAEQQRAESKRIAQLTGLTRQRTAAERDLLSVQRMAMGDQFTFQGVIGTMRIADKSDTNRLQIAHTEALQRVNMTLLNIDTQLESIAS